MGKRASVRRARQAQARRLRRKKQNKGGPGTQQTTRLPPSCDDGTRNEMQSRVSSIQGHVRNGTMVGSYEAIRYASAFGSAGNLSPFSSISVKSDTRKVAKSDQDAAKELKGMDFETLVKSQASAQGGGGGGGGEGGGDGTPPDGGEPESDEQKKNWEYRIDKALDFIDQGKNVFQMANTADSEGIAAQASFMNVTDAVMEHIDAIDTMGETHNDYITNVIQSTKTLVKDTSFAAFPMYTKYGDAFADTFQPYLQQFQVNAQTVLNYMSKKERFGKGVDEDLPPDVAAAMDAMAQAEDIMTEVMYAQHTASAVAQSKGDVSQQPAMDPLMSGERLTLSLLENKKVAAQSKEIMATEVGLSYLSSLISNQDFLDTASPETQAAAQRTLSNKNSENPPAYQGAYKEHATPTQLRELGDKIRKATVAAMSTKAEKIADAIGTHGENQFSVAKTELSGYAMELSIVPDIAQSLGQMFADDTAARTKEDLGQTLTTETRKQMEDLLSQGIGMSLDLHITNTAINLVNMTMLDTLGSTPHHSTKTFKNNPKESVTKGSVLDKVVQTLKNKLSYQTDGVTIDSTSSMEASVAAENYFNTMGAIDDLNIFRAGRDAELIPLGDRTDEAKLLNEKLELQSEQRSIEASLSNLSGVMSGEQGTTAQKIQVSMNNFDKAVVGLQNQVNKADIPDSQTKQKVQDSLQKVAELQTDMGNIDSVRSELQDEVDVNIARERNDVLNGNDQARILKEITKEQPKAESVRTELGNYQAEAGKRITEFHQLFQSSEATLNKVTNQADFTRKELNKAQTTLNDQIKKHGKDHPPLETTRKVVKAKEVVFAAAESQLNMVRQTRENLVQNISDSIQKENTLRTQLTETSFVESFMKKETTAGEDTWSLNDSEVRAGTDSFYNNLPNLSDVTSYRNETIVDVVTRQESERQLAKADLSSEENRKIFESEVDTIWNSLPKSEALNAQLKTIKKTSRDLTSYATDNDGVTLAAAGLGWKKDKNQRNIDRLDGLTSDYVAAIGRFQDSVVPKSYTDVSTSVYQSLNSLNTDVMNRAADGRSWAVKMIQKSADTYVDSLNNNVDTFVKGVETTNTDNDGMTTGERITERQVLRDDFFSSLSSNALTQSQRQSRVRDIMETSIVLPGHGGTGDSPVITKDMNKGIHGSLSTLITSLRDYNPSGLRSDQHNASELGTSRKADEGLSVDLSHYYGLQRSENFIKESPRGDRIFGGWSVKKGEGLSPRADHEMSLLASKLKAQISDVPRSFNDGTPQKSEWGSEGPLLRAVKNIETIRRNQNTMGDVYIINDRETLTSFSDTEKIIKKPLQDNQTLVKDLSESLNSLAKTLPDDMSTELSGLVQQMLSGATAGQSIGKGYGSYLTTRMFRDKALLNRMVQLTDHIVKSPHDVMDASNDAIQKDKQIKAELKANIDHIRLAIANMNSLADNPDQANSFSRSIVDGYFKPIVRDVLNRVKEGQLDSHIYPLQTNDLGDTIRTPEALQRAYADRPSHLFRDPNLKTVNTLIKDSIVAKYGKVGEDLYNWMSKADGSQDVKQREILNSMLSHKSERLLVNLDPQSRDTEHVLIHPPNQAGVRVSPSASLQRTATEGQAIDPSIVRKHAQISRRVKDSLSTAKDDFKRKITELESDPEYRTDKENIQSSELTPESKKDLQNKITAHETEINKHKTELDVINRVLKSDRGTLERFQGSALSFTTTLGTKVTRGIDRLQKGKWAQGKLDKPLDVTHYEESLYALSGKVLDATANYHKDKDVRDAAKLVQDNREKLYDLRNQDAHQRNNAETSLRIRKEMGTLRKETHDALRLLQDRVDHKALQRDFLGEVDGADTLKLARRGEESNIERLNYVRDQLSQVKDMVAQFDRLATQSDIMTRLPDSLKQSISELQNKDWGKTSFVGEMSKISTELNQHVRQEFESQRNEEAFVRMQLAFERATNKDKEIVKLRQEADVLRKSGVPSDNKQLTDLNKKITRLLGEGSTSDTAVGSLRNDIQTNIESVLRKKGANEDTIARVVDDLVNNLASKNEIAGLGSEARDFISQHISSRNIVGNILKASVSQKQSRLQGELQKAYGESYFSRLEKFWASEGYRSDSKSRSLNDAHNKLIQDIKQDINQLNVWNGEDLSTSERVELHRAFKASGLSDTNINRFEEILTGERSLNRQPDDSGNHDNVMQALNKFAKEIDPNSGDESFMPGMLYQGIKSKFDGDNTASLSNKIGVLNKRKLVQDQLMTFSTDMADAGKMLTDPNDLSSMTDVMTDVKKVLHHLQKLPSENVDVNDPIRLATRQAQEDGLTLDNGAELLFHMNSTLKDLGTDQTAQYGETLKRQQTETNFDDAKPQVVLRAQLETMKQKGWLEDPQFADTPMEGNLLQRQNQTEARQKQFQKKGADPLTLSIDGGSITSPFSQNKTKREGDQIRESLKRDQFTVDTARELVADNQINAGLLKRVIDLRSKIEKLVDLRDERAREERFIEKIMIVIHKETGTVRKLTSSEYDVMIKNQGRENEYVTSEHSRIPVDRQTKATLGAGETLAALKNMEYEIKELQKRYKEARAELGLAVLEKGFPDALAIIKRDMSDREIETLSKSVSTMLGAAGAIAAVASKRIGATGSQTEANTRRNLDKLKNSIRKITDLTSDRMTLGSDHTIGKDGQEIATPWMNAYGEFFTLFHAESPSKKIKELNRLFGKDLDDALVGNLVHQVLAKDQSALTDNIMRTLKGVLPDGTPTKDLDTMLRDNPADAVQLLKKAAESDEQAARLLSELFQAEGINQYHGFDKDTLTKALDDINALVGLRLPDNIIAGMLSNGTKDSPMTVTPELKHLIKGIIAASNIHDSTINRLDDPSIATEFARKRHDTDSQGEGILNALAQNMRNFEHDTFRSGQENLIPKVDRAYSEIKKRVENILGAKDSAGKKRSLDNNIERILNDIAPDAQSFPMFVAAMTDVVQARLNDIPPITEGGFADGAIQGDVGEALVDMACATHAFSTAEVGPTTNAVSGTPDRQIVATTHSVGESGFMVTVHDSHSGQADHYVLNETSHAMLSQAFAENGMEDMPSHVKSLSDFGELLNSIAEGTAEGKVLLTGASKDDLASWAEAGKDNSNIVKQLREDSDLRVAETSMTLQAGGRDLSNDQASNTNPEGKDHLAQAVSEWQKVGVFDADTKSLDSLFNNLEQSANVRTGLADGFSEFQAKVESGSFIGGSQKTASISSRDSMNASEGADLSQLGKSRKDIMAAAKDAKDPQELASFIRQYLVEFNNGLRLAGDRITSSDKLAQGEKESASILINQAIGDLNFQSNPYQTQDTNLHVAKMSDPLTGRMADEVYRVKDGEQSESTKSWLNNIVDSYFKEMGTDVPQSLRDITSIPASFLTEMTSSLNARSQLYDRGSNESSTNSLLSSMNAGVSPKDLAASLHGESVSLTKDWHPWMNERMDTFFSKNDPASLDAINASSLMSDAVKEVISIVNPATPISTNAKLTAADLNNNRVKINQALAQQTVQKDRDMLTVSRNLVNENITNNDYSFLSEHFNNISKEFTAAQTPPIEGEISQRMKDTENKVNQAMAELHRDLGSSLTSDSFTTNNLLDTFNSNEHKAYIEKNDSPHPAFNTFLGMSQSQKADTLRRDLELLTNPGFLGIERGSVNNKVLEKWKSQGLVSDEAMGYMARLPVDTLDFNAMIAQAEGNAQVQNTLHQMKFLQAFKESYDNLPQSIWSGTGYNTKDLIDGNATIKEIAHSLSFRAMSRHNEESNKSLRVLNEASKLLSVGEKIMNSDTEGLYQDVSIGSMVVNNIAKAHGEGAATAKIVDSKKVLRGVSDSEIFTLLEKAKHSPAPVKELINTLVSEFQRINKGDSSVTITPNQLQGLKSHLGKDMDKLSTDLKVVRALDNSNPDTKYDSPLQKTLAAEMTADDRNTLENAIEVLQNISKENIDDVGRQLEGDVNFAVLSAENYGTFTRAFDTVTSLLPQSIRDTYEGGFSKWDDSITGGESTMMTPNQAQALLSVRQVYGGPTVFSTRNQAGLNKGLKKSMTELENLQSTVNDLLRVNTTQELDRINAAREKRDLPPLKDDPSINHLLNMVSKDDSTPQDQLMLKKRIAQNPQIKAAIKAAKDSLVVLGANSDTLYKKLQVAQNSMGETDSLALMGNPFVQTTEILSQALDGLAQHFDEDFIVQQIVGELSNKAQTDVIQIWSEKVEQKYTINPASKIEQPAKDIDSQMTDMDQTRRERDQADKKYRDLQEKERGVLGMKNRHSLPHLVDSISSVSNIVGLAANVTELLKGLKDPTSMASETNPLAEVNNHLSEMRRLLESFAPDRATNISSGTSFEDNVKRVDIASSVDQDGNERSATDNLDYLTATQGEGEQVEQTKDTIQGSKSIMSKEAKAYEKKVDFFRSVEKGSKQGLARIMEIGNMYNGGIIQNVRELSSQIATPFLRGSGKTSSSASIVKGWSNISKKHPHLKGVSDNLLTAYVTQAFGPGLGAKVKKAAAQGMESVLQTLWDNQARGVVGTLVDLAKAHESLRYRTELAEKDARKSKTAPVPQNLQFSPALKTSGKVSMAEHVTDLAGEASLREGMMGLLKDDDLVQVHGEFNEFSTRLLDLIGKNSLEDNTKVSPLVSERRLEFGLLQEILNTEHIAPGDLNEGDKRTSEDMFFAKQRLETLKQQERLEDPGTDVLFKSGEVTKFTAEAHDKAQELLNKTAASLGMKSVPELNHAYINDKLADNDPITQAIMQIASENQSPNANPEDQMVAFVSVASVMGFHDLAFPGNNTYAQDMMAGAIKQSQGAFSDPELQSFMSSTDKQQAAFRNIADKIDRARYEGTPILDARNALTDEQLSALDSSTPNYSIRKNRSGELRVQLEVANLDGKTVKFTAQNNHLMSTEAATLGLTIPQAIQVNDMYQQGGPVAAVQGIRQLNDSLSPDDVTQVVDTLERNQTDNETGLLIPFDHIGTTGRDTQEGGEVAGYMKALSGKAETSAKAIIDGVVQRSGGKDVADVNFSSKHSTPTLTPIPGKEGSFLLNVPYTMIGKPTNYANKTEWDILASQVDGFEKGFAKYHEDKGTPIRVYDAAEVISKSQKQHKKEATTKIKPLADTSTVKTTDTEGLSPAELVQSMTIDRLEQSATTAQNTSDVIMSPASKERLEAIKDIADVEFYGKEGLSGEGQMPSEVTRDAIDYLLASKEAPSLDKLQAFAKETPTKKETEEKNETLASVSPDLKAQESLANKNPEDFLQGDTLKEYRGLTTSLRQDAKRLQKAEQNLTKTISSREAVEATGPAMTEILGKLYTERSKAEDNKRYDVNDLNAAKEAITLWKQATDLVQSAGLLDNIPAGKVDAVVKANYEKLTDTLGTQKKYGLESTPKKLLEEVDFLKGEITRQEKTIKEKEKEIIGLKDQLGHDFRLADDATYQKAISNQLGTVEALATSLSRKVKRLSELASGDLATSQSSMRELFDSVQGGFEELIMDHDTFDKFINMGIKSTSKRGLSFIKKGKGTVTQIYESVNQELMALLSEQDPYSLHDLHKILDLEEKMEQINEAVYWLSSLESRFSNQFLSKEYVIDINETANDYMDLIAA